jgi:hypothetical protein
LVLLLLLALTRTVQAQFTYATNNGAITITGYTGPGGSVIIPNTINGLPVTSIGGYAFYGQQSLTNITIPSSVTKIGEWAFSNSALSVVTIPGSVADIGVNAFNSCYSLTSLTLSNGVGSIEAYAFYYCSRLTNVSILSSVTNIGTSAFADCGSLTAIAVDASNPFYRSIGDVLYNHDQSLLLQYPAGKIGTNYVIPSAVTNIGASAFAGCYNLNSVTIPSNMSSIGDGAFSQFFGLTNFTIPSGVTKIGSGAFHYCWNLNSVAIPNSVTSLGDEAFYYCSSLSNVTIPDSVTNIGDRAFYECDSLYSVAIPNSLTSIGAYVFANCGNLTNVTIPSSVTKIGEGAFDGSGLIDLTIPGNVATVEANAFENCYILTSLTISNGVASIGTNAFYSCGSLTNVSIPSSVTNIGPAAFAGCDNLTAFTVDALNPFYRSVDGVLYNQNETVLVEFPGGKTNNYTIANSATTIGVSAFEYCTGLISVTIGNGVTDIQDHAFYLCENLTSVSIGNSVTNIGPGAFYNCSSLATIAFPDSIRNIGDEAFVYCSALTSVVFNGDAPILGGANAFDTGNNITVYYLPGTSGWGPMFGGHPTAPWLLQHPLITVQPFGNTIERGAQIGLAVRAIGRSVLSYQWKHYDVNLSNGASISGANTANLLIENARLSDIGEYTVTVSDSAGSIVSQPAQLNVVCVLTNKNEAFLMRSFARDTNGFLTLSWDSCGCYLYEVQTSEELLTSANWTARGLMIGEDGATRWTDFDPPASNHRFYRVQRYDPGGDEDFDGLSNIIEFNRGTDLHNPDTDGDGMPDGWEVKYGFNPLDPNDAYSDLDGDGYSNLEEYQAHTRPNDPSSYPGNPPPEAWWKLDEGIGTNVFDSSLNGHSHNGYLLGGNPAGAWAMGYLSNAVTLGGPFNNWIEVQYQPNLTPNQELTLMGWVKPFGEGVLIGNWDAPGQVSGNYRLQFGPDIVELRFSPAGDGSHSTLQFNPGWTTNQWHHVAVRYSDGTNVTVLVDGEARASQTVTGPFVPVANPILLGFPGLPEASSVDDVRLYNRALDTNEIAALSRGNGLPVNMIVGEKAKLRAFGASDGDTCQWSVVSGQGFFTNQAGCTTEFLPSWSGAVAVQVVWTHSGVAQTNSSSTTVAFNSLSPLSDWNDGGVVQYNNNCYNFATDIRTDTIAQPGGPPFYYLYTCQQQTSGAIADGLQAGADLADLCHTSGLPGGHIVALLVWPNWDFHYLRMEANGTWSSKAGGSAATTLDNSGQLIVDPRTANFAPYQFCEFLWVGPNVNILHNPQ